MNDGERVAHIVVGILCASVSLGGVVGHFTLPIPFGFLLGGIFGGVIGFGVGLGYMRATLFNDSKSEYTMRL